MQYQFVSENPTQILCDHYQFLLEAMDPDEIYMIMHSKSLLSRSDLNTLLFHFPINYMRNSFLLECVRNFKTSTLFVFIEALQKIDSQKQICETLLNGMYVYANMFAFNPDKCEYKKLTGLII